MIRDRMGIKPFYYYETADGVLFGSEPKAILANPLARRSVSLDGLRELFTLVKTPGHAVWDGMQEVEPGTVVTVDRGRPAHPHLLVPGDPRRTPTTARPASPTSANCSTTSSGASSSPTCRAACCSPAASTPPR